MSLTFPPFEPRPGSRGPFAESWWGRAWVQALEQTSMDAGRLARGRTYARGGYVDMMTVVPGRVSAPVHGSRPRPYRTTMTVRRFTDEEWDRLLDAAAANAGHIAALLDRDLPTGLAEEAAAVGVRLLPGTDDLDPSCSCPDWGHPCKHAAALCYQTARLLDQDPFVLLLLRGRDERELLDDLQARNARHAAREAPAPASGPARGVPAHDAYAREPRPLPAPPPPVDRPGTPPVLPPARGIEADDVELLAADAVLRAYEALTAGTTDPAPELDLWQDTVRLAAAHPVPDLFARLCTACGRRPRDLVRAVRAWGHGGPAALSVLEAPWTVPPADLARARAALAAAWEGEEPPPFKQWRNRWTFPALGLQLRYGRDARWYPYEQDGGEWSPCGPPERDPAGVLAAGFLP